MVYTLRLENPRPFFAEVPYYVWGEVNYDSEGDCRNPTDRSWRGLYLKHRETREEIGVVCEGDYCTVDGPDPAAARVARFLEDRCGATPVECEPADHVGDWDHERALERARRVAAVFERPELKPFDAGHWFWGSWKWIGGLATEFTWPGRWIMDSILTGDSRAVNLCAGWLRHGTVAAEQSQALRYAVQRLTGLSFDTDAECVEWYFHGPGEKEYPEPDFQAWQEELTARTADLLL